jgi:hypothetical protein
MLKGVGGDDFCNCLLLGWGPAAEVICSEWSHSELLGFVGYHEDLVVCFGFGYSLLLRFLGDYQIKNLLKVFEAPEYYDLWGASDAMMHFAKMYIK